MKEKKKTKCLICGKFISNNNYNKHINCCSLEKDKQKYLTKKDYKNRDSLFCIYCNKECKNINSLMNHERTCKYNSNRQETTFCNKTKMSEIIKKQGYSNGAIKAKLEGREWVVSLETKKKLSIIKTKNNPSFKQENRDKIRKTIMNKIKEGTWHVSKKYHNIKQYEYNGIILQGKWEVEYAKYLDKNNIQWKRPEESFVYYWNNKEHYYFPDFYLIESDTYVEIKGIPSDRDYAKWNNFPHKLKILYRKDLRKLGIKV